MRKYDTLSHGYSMYRICAVWAMYISVCTEKGSYVGIVIDCSENSWRSSRRPHQESLGFEIKILVEIV